MLVDRIALLERQLESAEKQVRNAEDGARNAKSALAAALLTKARHQKSEAGSENPRNGASQQPDPSEVSDDAADALRQEYEQRFRTARERLVEEFQERLDNAKAAWEADVARQPRRESADGFNLMPGRLLPSLKNGTGHGQPAQKLASSLPVAFRRLLRSLAHRPAALLLALAAATGTFLGWSALSGKYAPSEPAPSVATAPSPSEIAPPAPVPPAPVPVTSAPAPIPQAEPVLVPAAGMPAAEALPDSADKAQASDAIAESMGAAQPLQAPIEQKPATPEPSAAPLQEELNALRERLDAATKRARLAEETLRAERRKTAAAQARQAQTGLKEQAPAMPAAAASARVPGQVPDAGLPPGSRLDSRRSQAAE